MKKIIFLRHGKAEDKGQKVDDWTRLLTDKGISQTKENIVEKLDKIGEVDCIVSSASWRAKMTADVAAKIIGFDRNKIIYDSRLLTDDYTTIIDCINSLDDTYNRVMIVGHNDALSDAMNFLTQQNIGPIPKSGLVGQTFTSTIRHGVNKNTRQKQWKYYGD